LGLLSPLVNRKKENSVPISTVFDTLKQIIESTPTNGNNNNIKRIRTLIGPFTGYLFSLTVIDRTFCIIPDEVFTFFCELHDQYFTMPIDKNDKQGRSVLGYLLSDLMQRYTLYIPQFLTLNLKRAFDNQTPMRKKLEALDMALPFMRKDLVSNEAYEIVFKKCTKILTDNLYKLAQKRENEELVSNQESIIQKLFIAKNIYVLYRFILVASVKHKKKISRGFLESGLSLVDKGELVSVFKPYSRQIKQETIRHNVRLKLDTICKQMIRYLSSGI